MPPFSWLSCCFALVSTCSINLDSTDPPITPTTLEALLRNRRQGCPDPLRLSLSGNELTFLPETTTYTLLNAFSCLRSPVFTQQQLTLEACQGLCTTTPDCAYIEFTNACSMFALEGCSPSLNNSQIYRKEISFVGMDGFASLIRLDLSGNQFTTIPQGIARFSKLTELDLSDNGIKTLPSDFFSRLTALEILTLQQNNLTEFSPGVFDNLTDLQFLDLESNHLRAIPESLFGPLTELTALYLDVNKLTALPPTLFQTLSKLTDLRLSSNSLASLPPAILRNLTKLKNLELRNNQVSSLSPDVFQGLTNLNTISMTRNRLIALPPDLFRGLKKLTTLEMDRPPACSLVRRCSGQVQVGKAVVTFVTVPTVAPTNAPSPFPTIVPLVTPTVALTTNAPAFTTTPAPTSSPTPQLRSSLQETQGTLSAGIIAGIVIGILGCLCLFCGGLFLLRRHRFSKLNQPVRPAPAGETGTLLVNAPEKEQEREAGGCPKVGSAYNIYTVSDSIVPLAQVFTNGSHKYTVVKVLGKGNFGTAYLVTDPNMKNFVVKTTNCTDQNDALKEAKTLALNTPASPHLLKILDFFFETDQLFCMVLNYCKGGSLQDLVPQNLPLGEIERILREIATGLECLHVRDVIHRDLKPDNIFLLDPESRTVVIGDMGMARPLDLDGYYDSWFGHVLYKAPEIREGKFSPRSDMWAVGCVGLELLSGEPLAARYLQNKLILGKTTSSELALVLDKLPEHCKGHPSFEMVSRLLVHDAHTRLTAQQLRLYPSSPTPETPTPIFYQ